MAIELTHICDRCGARHTGANPPTDWHKDVTLSFDAPLWPSYSPRYVNHTAALLCSKCADEVSKAVKTAWGV